MKKTPREILWQRHQSADASLDALRKAIVAEHVIAPQFLAEEPDAPAFSLRMLPSKLWEELVLPCKRVWLGMATVWLAILAFQFVSSGAPQMAVVKTAPPTPEVMASLKEQSLLRRQLLDLITPPAALGAAPGPRSERHRGLFGV